MDSAPASRIDSTALVAGGVELRASALRLLPAAFLAFWLCGWAAGELFVGAFLAAIAARALGFTLPLPDDVELPGGEPGGFDLFLVGLLLLWFAFWTFGGIAAMRQLGRLLVGCERLALSGGELEVTRTAGPFTRTERLALHDVARLEDGKAGLAAHLRDGSRRTLAMLGGTDERRALAGTLSRAAGLEVET